MQSIDSHQHFWKLAQGDYRWLTPELRPLYRDFGPEDLEPLLRDAGVQATVVVQAADSAEETRFLLELATRHAWIRGVVGWVDMESPAAPELLARLAADRSLRGIRPMIQDIPDPEWMLRDGLTPALRVLVEQELTFDALVKPVHLPHLLRLLERHPDLRVVVDHGAKPEIAAGRFEPWASDLALVAARTGAYCKLSGLVTEARPDWKPTDLAPYIDHLFECFGVERLMWGSDWPVVNLAGGYPVWRELSEAYMAGLTQRDRNAVLGANALHFYGLGHGGASPL